MSCKAFQAHWYDTHRYSDTIMEAKSSVDRLHDIVYQCYQEMSARVHALELREMQRMSCALPLQVGKDDVVEGTIWEMSQTALDSDSAPMGEDIIAASDYLEDLKRSWVYRRNSAFRASTFSSDRNSTTWSCFSDLSMSEVSNFSVINLAISLEDVENPQRLSQTWSNETMGPMWPLQSHVQIPEHLITSGGHHMQEELCRTQAHSDNDDDASSTTTVKEDRHSLPGAAEGTPEPSKDSLESINNPWFDNSNVPPKESSQHEPIEFQSKGDLEEDNVAYPCKGCGEILEEGKAFELGKEKHLLVNGNQKLIKCSG